MRENDFRETLGKVSVAPLGISIACLLYFAVKGMNDTFILAPKLAWDLTRSEQLTRKSWDMADKIIEGQDRIIAGQAAYIENLKEKSRATEGKDLQQPATTLRLIPENIELGFYVKDHRTNMDKRVCSPLRLQQTATVR